MKTKLTRIIFSSLFSFCVRNLTIHIKKKKEISDLTKNENFCGDNVTISFDKVWVFDCYLEE
jgi:hypothetical protein